MKTKFSSLINVNDSFAVAYVISIFDMLRN